MNAAVGKISKSARVVRVSDASVLSDLTASLQSGGMFEEARTVVLDSVLQNEEMRNAVFEALPALAKSTDHVFILEEKPDAATRKQIEKYAATSERFDSAAKKREGNIFALANALKRGDKKSLWVGYQSELAKNVAPEAIHGILFWGAKDMFMKARDSREKMRAGTLVATLAELPHEARRRGVDLEYALEHFVLASV